MALGPIVFRLHLFEEASDRRRSETVLLWLLEALVRINLTWLQSHPDVPPLYRAPVRYQFDSRFPDAWKDIPTILDDGQGDCEDIACWRIAELVNVGIRGVRPYLRWRKQNDHYIYHVLVYLPDGRVEDPSLAMGMAGPEPRKPIFVEPDDSFSRSRLQTGEE